MHMFERSLPGCLEQFPRLSSLVERVKLEKGRGANAGDWVPGTEVRIHYAPNMIVVSEISEEVIEAALRHLASTGELEECTRAY